MSRIAYVDGRYVPLRAAHVNVEDRGLQFADSVYEVLHLSGGRFTDEVLHLARLDRSLGELRLPAPMARGPLLRVLHQVAARNRLRDGLVYMQVTRGTAKRNHAFPSPSVPPTLIVTARRVPPYPVSVDRWATRVITHPDARWDRCDIKSTGLLPNVLARQAAIEQGASEAVLFTPDGVVTEGAATSIWLVDQSGTLRVPPLTHAILPGCTRAALQDLVRETGLALEERAFSRAEIDTAQEMFLTSATSFVRPITHVDGRPVRDGQVGPMTRRLFALFAQHVNGGSNQPLP